eukprot:scaffold2961_cov166-Chaetoceros_neogracile.AAC.8
MCVLVAIGVGLALYFGLISLDDDCDKAKADVRLNTTMNVFMSMNMTCPDGVKIPNLDISEDAISIFDIEILKKRLREYCRVHCDT